MPAVAYLQPPSLRVRARARRRWDSWLGRLRHPVRASTEGMDRRLIEAEAMMAAARNAFAPLDIRIEGHRLRYVAAPEAEALLGEGGA